jgi:uncharacterized membrane protein
VRLGVALVLGSALLHAAWNAILKRERDPRLAVVPVCGVAALLGTIVAIATPGIAFPTRAAWVFSLVAGVFEGAYFFTLGRALAGAPLGIVYTVSRGGALLLVWPFSIVMLAENVNSKGIAGTMLVALGLAATASEERTAGTSRAGLLFASACAACIAGYHLAYKYALAAGAMPASTLALSMTTGVVLNVVVLDRDRRRAAGVLARSPTVLVAGALAGGSFLLFLFALTGGGAGAMLTLRNTSVVFAQLFAVFIGERSGARRWTGALLVAAGAILLGLRG